MGVERGCEAVTSLVFEAYAFRFGPYGDGAMSKSGKPPRDLRADIRYAGRDRAIIRFIVDYRAVFYQSLAAVFLGDRNKAVGHITTRLADRGLLTVQKRQLPGGVTYVASTAEGCRFVDAPKERADVISDATLDMAIAVTWYCTMDRKRRFRIYRDDDLVPAFSEDFAPPPNLVHIASDSEPDAHRTHPCIARAYLCSSEVRTCVEHLHLCVDDTMTNPHLRPWIEAGDYFWLGLTDDASKLTSLRHAVTQSPTLRDVCHVALAPTSGSLARFLKERNTRGGAA